MSKDRKSRDKKYYEKHKISILKQRLDYYCKHRKHRLQQMKDYHQDNKVSVAIRKKQYREKHKEHIIQHQKEYLKTQNGKFIHKRANAKRRKLGFNKLIENDWNEPVEWHHINDVDVVPIPKDLHKMCLRGTTEEHREICNELINILYDGELRI